MVLGGRYDSQRTACSHFDIDYEPRYRGLSREQVDAAIMPLLRDRSHERMGYHLCLCLLYVPLLSTYDIMVFIYLKPRELIAIGKASRGPRPLYRTAPTRLDTKKCSPRPCQ